MLYTRHTHLSISHNAYVDRGFLETAESCYKSEREQTFQFNATVNI